jgi:FtsZ-binding cell division protein ZapB
MLKNKNDIFFGFCITFIIILALYLVIQRTQQDNLEKYLQLLKDKIAGMMDKEDKAEIDQFFSELINGLDSESVPPQAVEKLAESIIELRKKKTKLSKEDLHKLIPSFKTDSVDLKDHVKFEYLESGDWQKLAFDFEQSFAMCNNIRKNREEVKQWRDRLKKQIDIHGRISRELKENSVRAIEKFEKIKKIEITPVIEKELLKEIERLKEENQKIYQKLSSLDHMRTVLDKERKKLQKELENIDSLRSVVL